ncbi:hypothetical protein [Bartonella sp. B41]
MAASFTNSIFPDYTNFPHIFDIIKDEIDDLTNEYFRQIQNSVLVAFRLCSKEPFFFNEKKVMTFETQRGKIWYGEQEGVFSEENVVIDSLCLKAPDGIQTHLHFKTLRLLQQQFEMSEFGRRLGVPTFYTYSDDKIGLFPAPKDVEVVHLFYFPDSLSEGNVWNDDSPWMIHAFELIKARAKYDLYKNVLKDPELAAISFNDFQEQLKILREETSRRKCLSKIHSVEF